MNALTVGRSPAAEAHWQTAGRDCLDLLPAPDRCACAWHLEKLDTSEVPCPPVAVRQHAGRRLSWARGSAAVGQEC